jgi:hypothetical protein
MRGSVVAIRACVRRIFAILVGIHAVAACAGDDPVDGDEPGGDLAVGDLTGDDSKADGNWGAALTCKTGPELPALSHPEITVSLNGLTLHLVDRTTGFDKVFPIGPGAIDASPTSITSGESLSYFPIVAYGTHDFVIRPSTTTKCKIWWTDPDTHEKLPVFAGLPFLGWSGSYGIHGPIDNYRTTSGGSLRRGFVSHGCIRMEAAGILELAARIDGVASVPVHVQREVERTDDGDRVDVTPRWIGAECTTNDDCGYTNGFCKQNPWSRRGFCSARCTSSCADRPGQPTTFCVADGNGPGQGMCVAKLSAVNAGCRPYDHFVPAMRGRASQPFVTASVCVPGSPGWIGDRCLSNTDCTTGTTCSAGVCTASCTSVCADQNGYADTFCVHDATLGAGGSCVRQCTPASNASECAADMACVPRSRNGQASPVRNVCLPD